MFGSSRRVILAVFVILAGAVWAQDEKDPDGRSWFWTGCPAFGSIFLSGIIVRLIPMTYSVKSGEDRRAEPLPFPNLSSSTVHQMFGNALGGVHDYRTEERFNWEAFDGCIPAPLRREEFPFQEENLPGAYRSWTQLRRRGQSPLCSLR